MIFQHFEGIMQLATVYKSLSESGSVLPIHWRREFYCSKGQIEGYSIVEELAAAIKTMDKCYSNWTKRVSNARKEYRELNFFTTQQLLLLRKEIATVCHSGNLCTSNNQVLTLLESVRPNLDNEHLKSAIQHAFKDTALLNQTKGKSDRYLPSCTSRRVSDNNNYVNKSPSAIGKTSQAQAAFAKKPKPKCTSRIRRFLNAAYDHGYSVQIAVSALASLGVDAGKDELLLWCLKEANDADLESLFEKAMSIPAIAREIYQETRADRGMQLKETRYSFLLIV